MRGVQLAHVDEELRHKKVMEELKSKVSVARARCSHYLINKNKDCEICGARI